MKTLARMTTVAVMAAMIVSLSGLDALAGGHEKQKNRNKNTQYRVELRHPETRGVVLSIVKDTAAEADQVRATYARYHWAFWKYYGIGEPLRQQRFTSESTARNYKPDFGVLETQYVKAGRATVTEIPAPTQKKHRRGSDRGS